MENWDKDKRFMAASDLMQEITMSNSSLDLHLQKKVCQAFLKQLEDQSIDVQGNAVKCLAKIVCKFQEQQIGEVLAKLSQLVLDGKPEVRDIYATCLKGLLTELPSSCSGLACQNVLPKMLHGITSHPSVEVKEECTDVFHDFLKRFGDNRVMQWSDQENMATSLLNLLKPKQYKSSLRKKVIACIGALSSVLADRQLDSLMRTLLSDVRSASTKAEKQKCIQCISTVSRNVGFRIGQHLRDIAPLFLQIVNQATESDATMDGSMEPEKDHEIVENCLNAFESFVLRCSKEIDPHLEELCNLILYLIAYDPNFYNTGDEDAAMDDGFDEFDDDGLVDSDDDDSSWKVRRAALKVLAAMLKGLPDKLRDLYSKFAQPLIARFQEREESVKLDVFTTFAEMAQAAVIKSQSAVSSAQPVSPVVIAEGILDVERLPPPKERPAAENLCSILPNCVTQLNKQLRSKSLKTRQGALSLLRVLAETLPQHLEPNLPSVKDELFRSMKESNSSMRLDALITVRQLTEHFANANIYQQMAPTLCPLLLQCCNDSYYKSIAQSLRCIGVYVYPLRPTVANASAQLTEMVPVFEVLRVKMMATDIDQEVKESALECFGHLMACVGDLPAFQTALGNCLPPFVERVKNEVTRSIAIKALKTMCISKVQISALQSVLHSLGGQLSSYLSQNSRAFRQQCLDTLVNLVKKYGSHMPVETRMQILTDIVPFVTDTDLYITELCVQVADQILETTGMAPAVIEKCVPAVMNVCRSPLLQGGALDSILHFLSRVAQHRAHCPFERLRQELSDTSVVANSQAQAQRHVIGTLAKGLASVISASEKDVQEQAVRHFLSAVQDCPAAPGPEQVQQCELALLALGETGKYMDLSGTPGFCDTLLKQLQSSQDEVRLAAALALGYATVGAMGTLLKVVIDNVQQAGSTAKGQKTQYLLLTSLREVIAIGVAKKTPGDRSLAEHLKPHVPRVLPILSQYADSTEESVRNVVSESLGHLLMVDQEAVLQTLVPLLASKDKETWKVRAAAVSAIRFAAAKHCSAETLTPLKEPLLACLGDEELQVRKSALHSVNVVCRSATCGEILRQHTDMIFERLKEDSKQKPELIREVDLGPFKHKVDDGLPLRKIAYLVCTSLLAAYPEQVASPGLIDLVLQGLADNEDVQVICCQLLQDLCSWSFALFRIIGRIGDLVEPFDRCIMRCIKQVQSKQQVGRAMDMLRLYARTLKVVEPIAESNQQKPFIDFMSRIMKDRAYQSVVAHSMTSGISLTKESLGFSVHS
jgi:cullin-associated NEDD8-dissociated protein 1